MKRSSVIFQWNKVPGDHEKKVKDYLIKSKSLRWVENASIEKDPNDKMIKVTCGSNSALFEYDASRKKVRLYSNKEFLDEFSVIIENDTKHIIENPKYVFRWEKVPGDDEKGLISFLTATYSYDWIEIKKMNIIKINDNIIEMRQEDYKLSFELNEDKSSVNLFSIRGIERSPGEEIRPDEIIKDWVDEFMVSEENQMLTIYELPQTLLRHNNHLIAMRIIGYLFQQNFNVKPAYNVLRDFINDQFLKGRPKVSIENPNNFSEEIVKYLIKKNLVFAEPVERKGDIYYKSLYYPTEKAAIIHISLLEKCAKRLNPCHAYGAFIHIPELIKDMECRVERNKNLEEILTYHKYIEKNLLKDRSNLGIVTFGYLLLIGYDIHFKDVLTLINPFKKDKRTKNKFTMNFKFNTEKKQKGDPGYQAEVENFKKKLMELSYQERLEKYLEMELDTYRPSEVEDYKFKVYTDPSNYGEILLNIHIEIGQESPEEANGENSNEGNEHEFGSI